MNNKSIITVIVDNRTTPEEIKEIRKMIKEEDNSCQINIVISGCEDFKSNLTEFIKARDI